jgi:primosomal protein N' (replication factor Y)
MFPKLARAQAGCRVSVSLVRARTRVGWILDVCEAADTDVSRCKPIQALIDETPLLDGEALYLLNVLHETTFCTWGASAHALVVPGAGVTMKTGLRAVVKDTDIPDTLSSEAKALYAHLRGKSPAVPQEKALAALGLAAGHACVAELAAQGLVERSQLVRRRVADERAVMARLAQGPVPQKLTAKQRAVADLLESVGCASVRELCYFCGVTPRSSSACESRASSSCLRKPSRENRRSRPRPSQTQAP